MSLLPISNTVDSPGVPEDLQSTVSLQSTLYCQVTSFTTRSFNIFVPGWWKLWRQL